MKELAETASALFWVCCAILPFALFMALRQDRKKAQLKKGTPHARK